MKKQRKPLLLPSKIILLSALTALIISCGNHRPSDEETDIPVTPITPETQPATPENQQTVPSGTTPDHFTPPSALVGTTPSDTIINQPTPPSTPDTAGSGSPTKEPTIETTISFEADIKPLLEPLCVACHGNPAVGSALGAPQIDWLDYETSKNAKDILRERVWDLRNDPVKGMPQHNPAGLTEDQRKLVKDWVESGTPL